MGWSCGTCGKYHDGMVLDIAYRRPVQYFMVPEHARPLRVRESDDVCIIDDEIFAIRGMLYVPVPEIDSNFGWGVWAKISRSDFEHYWAMWDEDGSDHPPFQGRLDVEPKCYDGLYDHEVRVQLRTPDERPIFTLMPSSHRLYREQCSGYSVERVWEVVHLCAPHLLA